MHAALQTNLIGDISDKRRTPRVPVNLKAHESPLWIVQDGRSGMRHKGHAALAGSHVPQGTVQVRHFGYTRQEKEGF